MKSIEVKGKTIEQALKAGLIELSAASLDDVDVKVLKHPGIFSQAVVQMTLVGEIADKLDTTSPEALMSKIEKRAASAKQHVIVSKLPNAKNAPRPEPVQEKQSAVKNEPRKEQPPAKPDVKKFERQERPQEKERTVKPTAEEMEKAKASAAKYLETALKLMDITAQLKVSDECDEVNIDIVTDATHIIGYRGETLDSLEYLTMLAIEGDSRIKVNLDSGGYREKRTASLIELAKRLAEKAVRTGKKVDLEPMSSLNRKIIHSALSENDGVITRSEGHEPNRYLVIIPKKGGNGSNSNNGGNTNRFKNNNRHRKNGKGGSGNFNKSNNGKQAE